MIVKLLDDDCDCNNLSKINHLNMAGVGSTLPWLSTDIICIVCSWFDAKPLRGIVPSLLLAGVLDREK